MHALLEGHFPSNLLQDKTDFYSILTAMSTIQQLDSQILSNNLSGVELSEDILRIHGDRAKATTVAAVLEAVAQGKSVVRECS